MTLPEHLPQLRAPFPKAAVEWHAYAYSNDRTRALLLPAVNVQALKDRLDAVCPDWAFTAQPVPGAPTPTVRGALTLFGVTREDLGTHEDSLKNAATDALKRCAQAFGVGRYLYAVPKTWADWDDKARRPVVYPTLPDEALPLHEQATPSSVHMSILIDRLRRCLPADVEAQRELYKEIMTIVKQYE